LSPEAYASAGQITVEHGLALADLGRGDAFAAHRDTPGAFTFGSVLGSTRKLETGTAASAKTNSYGLVGGIGWASESGSVGVFAGYVDSRQRIEDLGTRTDADGVVAGVHARWSNGALGLKSTIAYDGSKAKTDRVLVDGSSRGRYDLHGLTADFSVDYATALSQNWTVKPALGFTAIRVTRDAVQETGTSVFGLDVARRRDHAAFVDGSLTFAGGQREGSPFRPYLSVGVRYQFDGKTPYAVAALDNGPIALGALGISRAPIVARATLGWDVAVSSQLSVFAAATGESGDADHRLSSNAGLRLVF